MLIVGKSANWCLYPFETLSTNPQLSAPDRELLLSGFHTLTHDQTFFLPKNKSFLYSGPQEVEIRLALCPIFECLDWIIGGRISKCQRPHGPPYWSSCLFWPFQHRLWLKWCTTSWSHASSVRQSSSTFSVPCKLSLSLLFSIEMFLF